MTKRKCSIGRMLKRDYAVRVFPYLCAARAKRKLHDLITSEPELLLSMVQAGWSDHSLSFSLKEQTILAQHGFGGLRR